MRKGSVFQRHTRSCPRGADNIIVTHKCRGPWAYYVLVGRRLDGQRRQITRSGYRTKRAAETALREALAREDAGIAEIHGLRVKTYLRQWLVGKRALRATTRSGYRQDIERHLVPGIGHLLLSDLRPHHIDLLYGDLLASSERPVGPAVIRHLHTTLRSAMSSAVKRRLIPWNPAVHVELPEETRRPTTVWTPQQLQHFLGAISSHRLQPLFRLVAVTGLRRGEALGLHWVDVDLDGAAFTVRWQLVDAGSGAKLSPPKTKSGGRVVVLDAGTIASLRQHRRMQERERAQWGEGWVDHGLVFTREDGTPLRPEYVTHLFARLSREHALAPIRLHDLRHTNASLALAAGVPLKVVSQRLGHSTTAITSDLYTHVIPIVAREAADLIAALIGEPMEARPTEVEKSLSSADLARDPDLDGETTP